MRKVKKKKKREEWDTETTLNDFRYKKEAFKSIVKVEGKKVVAISDRTKVAK